MNYDDMDVRKVEIMERVEKEVMDELRSDNFLNKVWADGVKAGIILGVVSTLLAAMIIDLIFRLDGVL